MVLTSSGMMKRTRMTITKPQPNRIMVLSQYGRELISRKQKSPTITTKKQTMVSKEEVAEMIDFAINQHNRNAGQISMVLGFTFMALFADGLFRTLGLIPPFMGIDVSIVQDVVEAIKDQVSSQL